ncbi:DUF6292 family protein [Streptomyces sp. CB03238]|uniref:DUF6292 family protein n=1 Tax=Streptomyces sp. CB03238 TaxID=1907777 RepID=UPI000A10BB3C|nr:DUF6292 family protein [Streptomyces sp. CB03238]ORT54186.1 hypothetical protein BKD26_35935 [Streptomyces sp. CB03238]
MIRAARKHLVRTLADLAQQQGVQLQTYLNAKRHAAEGFPAPISSKGARTKLYDAEQVDAYLAGAPVPPLPDENDDQDLLDRRECAEVLGVSPRTWDSYKADEQLTANMVEVGGVEHWPRHVVDQFKASRQGRAATTGRPKRSGDQVPREQLLARTAPLLDEDPAISAAGVVDALGVHRDTAQDALTQLRAGRIADLMQDDSTLTPEQAATALGYPASQVRRALVLAQAVLRGRRIAPYLADVAEAVHQAGWTTADTVPALQHPTDDLCVATLVLDTPQAPAPALVWDERYGWRTAPSRRHPLGRGAAKPPAGDGVRYLASGTTPDPDTLVAELTP